MQAKFVSITKSFVPDAELTAEDLIIYIARVSSPQNQTDVDTAPRLLRYLMRNEHWSPFEFADMTIELETSRAVAAQILRHWSFSFQEVSQRYTSVTEMEEVELRRQAGKSRQSSTEIFDPEIQDPFIPYGGFETASSLIETHIMNGLALYKGLLDADVARECARMILPLTTRTRIYMKGSVRDFIHMLNIRTKPTAQKEFRELAIEIFKIFAVHFPVVAEVMREANENLREV